MSAIFHPDLHSNCRKHQRIWSLVFPNVKNSQFPNIKHFSNNVKLDVF